MITEAILQTKELKISYGQKTVLEEISVKIPAKKITAFVGPSGCGKTSFLLSLNRLIELVPSAQVSGGIFLELENLLDKKVNLINLRRNVGMIFQKPNPFPFSIRKNIELPLKEHGIKSALDRECIVHEVLKAVGLWNEVKDRLESSALNLSGGQQQRLCIARAIALKPKILLMDEPCSALDPISSGVVEDLIKSLRAKYTVAIVTHNLAQAKRLADYTAMFWVNNGVGKLIEFGPTKDIFENPKSEITAAYIAGLRG